MVTYAAKDCVELDSLLAVRRFSGTYTVLLIKFSIIAAVSQLLVA